MEEKEVWYHNSNLPPGLPDRQQVLRALDASVPRGWLSYPVKGPHICFIKYGPSVTWNNVYAQHTANTYLSEINPNIRAPLVYFAFTARLGAGLTTAIVMEYIDGETIESAQRNGSAAAEDDVASRVAGALNALARIPIDPGWVSPSAIDGSHIRHVMFDLQKANRLYETVQQLEDHINNVRT